MNKRIWLVVVIGVVAGAGLVWEESRSPRQVITSPDGEKYQFAGVTIGTNHVAGSMAARLVNRLPSSAANFVRKYLGSRLGPLESRSTRDPELFIWFRPLATKALPFGVVKGFVARLADQAGVEAGGGSGGIGFPRGGQLDWAFTPVSMVVPRRSRMLECYFYSGAPGDHDGSHLTNIARVSFPNPFYGRFPQWQAESVPAVKQLGDLEVRLCDFMTGHRVAGTVPATADGIRGLRCQPAAPGQDMETIFDVSFNSPRGTNEAWMLQSAELSDATGNLLRKAQFISSSTLSPDRVRPQPSGRTTCSEYFDGTLWPDEAAWRLKLEVKRCFGFATNELAVFRNVPIPELGTPHFTPITNIIGGMQVMLTHFIHRANINKMEATELWRRRDLASEIRVELPGKPSGVALDFVSVTADHGVAEQSFPSFDRGAAYYVLLLKTIPTNAQTMSFTWALQKPRTVEFLVKPPDRTRSRL
jgi:hypothetical protein